jgi:GNAT superfamily N-acetyltransferase
MATLEITYRYLVVDEDGLEADLRRGLAVLLAAILDDGERYRRRGWRTLRPSFRVVAIQADGEPIGQISAFFVPTRPSIRLIGLGDAAVAPDHRMRGVGRRLCEVATHEAWRLHASAILLKTKPMRKVFTDLGFTASTDGPFFYFENGERATHPDWMAAFAAELPPSVELEEGDF